MTLYKMTGAAKELYELFETEDLPEEVKRSISEEQQTRTRLADNYETLDRVLRQMYGGD